MNIVKKVAISSLGLLTAGALLAPAALAEENCTISGNGSGSSNTCVVTITNGGGNCQATCEPKPKQIRKAKVKNTVKIRQNTGENTANRNTGGNVSITTGDASADVNITNSVNNNGGGI